MNLSLRARRIGGEREHDGRGPPRDQNAREQRPIVAGDDLVVASVGQHDVDPTAAPALAVASRNFPGCKCESVSGSRIARIESSSMPTITTSLPAERSAFARR
jgi:hypothetical protein